MLIIRPTSPLYLYSLDEAIASHCYTDTAGVNRIMFSVAFGTFDYYNESPAPIAGPLSPCNNRSCYHTNFKGWLSTRTFPNLTKETVKYSLFGTEQVFNRVPGTYYNNRFNVLLLYGVPSKGTFPGLRVTFANRYYYKVKDVKYVWDGHTLSYTMEYTDQTDIGQPPRWFSLSTRAKVIWDERYPFPGTPKFKPGSGYINKTYQSNNRYADSSDPEITDHTTSYVRRDFGPSRSLSLGDDIDYHDILTKLILRTPVTDPQTWGRAASHCADACKKVDVNMIAYFSDFLKIKESLTIPDRLEDAYLSYKYGVRLTVSDTKKLMRAFHRATRDDLSYSWARAPVERTTLPCSVAQLRRTIGYKIYYRDPTTRLARFRKFLDDWDLTPNRENVWDLIPYSFTVDWFTDVAGNLNYLDNQGYIARLPIVETVKSDRYEFIAIDFPALGQPQILGDMSFILFRRYVGKNADRPLPEFSGVQPFSNQLELGAILVQKLR